MERIRVNESSGTYIKTTQDGRKELVTLACPQGERCVYRDETEAANPFIGIEQALQVALDAEHVAELKRWMQLHLSGAKLPTES